MTEDQLNGWLLFFSHAVDIGQININMSPDRARKFVLDGAIYFCSYGL